MVRAVVETVLSGVGLTPRPKPGAQSLAPTGGRLGWMDSARGIAISLVIFGHVVISSLDAGLVGRRGWWADAIFCVYTFHMPVFLFLSGLFVQKRIDADRGAFLRSILSTLVWPYLVWGAVALTAEQLGKGLRSNVGTSAIDISLLWTPVAWLWFLWALAMFHVLAVLLNRRPMLLVALGVAVLPLNGVFKLAYFPHQLSHFFIFYALGVALGPRVTKKILTPSPLVPVAAGIATVVFTYLALIAAQGEWADTNAWAFAATPAAFSGAIALCALAMQPGVRNNRLLMFLGRRSLPLYVNHIFFITAMRIVLVRLLGVTAFFPVIFVASLAVAYAAPLLIYELATRFGVTVLLGLGKPLSSKRSVPVGKSTAVEAA